MAEGRRATYRLAVCVIVSVLVAMAVIGVVVAAPSRAVASVRSPTTAVEFPSTGMFTNVQWAELMLEDGGWSTATSNVTAITQWMASENYPTTWWAPTYPTTAHSRNNPLNSGYRATALGGLGAYPTLTVAAYDVARQLRFPTFGYATIAADLTRDAPVATTVKAIQNSDWASSHYGHGADWYGEGKTLRPPTYRATAAFWRAAGPSLGVADPTATRIDGPTADATAADELEHEFAYRTGRCPGSTGTRPVVLATDATYPDALSSAYLARYLGTGALLTPTAALSTATLTAIHMEGITRVYVVGGSFAVSTAVVDQLASTPADGCGGTSTGAGDIRVTRIWGTTQYTTAEKIAEVAPASNVGKAAFPDAYAGTNTDGGEGVYNDTAGNASAGPSTSAALPTAIVATGTNYQDAEAASTLSYADRLPILLTTPSTLSSQTASAISTLGVRQVIVMGGQFAVSDAVVSSIEGQGVAVLRVGGQTFSATSVALAEFETGSASGGAGLGWAGTGALTVARGDAFTDGLAGAVVAAGAPAAIAPEPLVLTLSPTGVGTALASFLRTAGSVGIGGARVTALTVLGGALALSTTTVDAMESQL